MTKSPLTPLNIRVPSTSKNDFNTICKLNCTTMTSEIVRFINTFILSEAKRIKSYKIESKELNRIKQQRLIKKDVFSLRG